MSSSGCELLSSESDIRAKISASVGADGGTGTLGLVGCGGGGGGGVVLTGAGGAAGAGGGAAGAFFLPHAPTSATRPMTNTRGSTRAGCRNINSSRENARVPTGVHNESGGNKGANAQNMLPRILIGRCTCQRHDRFFFAVHDGSGTIALH